MINIDKKRSIGEVAKELDIPVHVIRFWEEQFPQIKPVIGKGKRRYFFDKHIQVIKRIKYFLYEEGYTIKGLKKMLKSNGILVKQTGSAKSKGDKAIDCDKIESDQFESLKNISSELCGVIDEFKHYLEKIS